MAATTSEAENGSVSISDLKPSSSRSSSITSKDEAAHMATSRANSVSRRASLPAQRLSVTQPSANPVLAATIATENSEKQSAARRASVATGMLSQPFQKSHAPKEAPRWRPATYRSQVGGNEASTSDEALRLSVEESVKPLTQKIFEKTAVSLALGLFVIFMAFVVGSLLRVVVRRNIGVLGLWVNQLVILLVYVNDKRPDEAGGGKRMDKFTNFEMRTLACQCIPIAYTLLMGNPYSYYGMCLMIVLQTIMKFLLMNAYGEVVEIPL